MEGGGGAEAVVWGTSPKLGSMSHRMGEGAEGLVRGLSLKVGMWLSL